MRAVRIDDGEAGEVTIIALRAKLYYLDRGDNSWKERGGGMLKINVPRFSVEYNKDGSPIVRSFNPGGVGYDESDSDDDDAAADDDDDSPAEDTPPPDGSPVPSPPKAAKPAPAPAPASKPAQATARLVMRQDSTLRVILNTTIYPGMAITERPSLKSTTVLFVALEGADPKPVNIQVKVSGDSSRRNRTDKLTVTTQMSQANAKAFTEEVKAIQDKLAKGV